LLAGGRGLSLARDEAATTSLLDDLRSDKGMEWLPQSMWLTFLPLSVNAGDLDYDLAIAANGTTLPSVRDAGVTAEQARVVTLASGRARWPWVAGGVVALATLLGITGVKRRRDPYYKLSPTR
jgi:hypothetical protein